MKEAGKNGIHNEDLLVIVIDRLRGFQSGPFKCRENAIAITKLERNKTIPLPGQVDPEEAMQAISLWKGSLIPTERAGYRGSPYLPLVYAEF